MNLPSDVSASLKSPPINIHPYLEPLVLPQMQSCLAQRKNTFHVIRLNLTRKRKSISTNSIGQIAERENAK